MRNNPKPRGVVLPRAFRNVLLPSALSGGGVENEDGRSPVSGPISFYFFLPPVGPRIVQPHTGKIDRANIGRMILQRDPSSMNPDKGWSSHIE